MHKDGSYVKGLVSILMPSYNNEKYIEKAIYSVLDQSYPDIELLITEDCSTDSSKEVVSQFSLHPKIRLFFNLENIGYLKSVNKMFAKCKGEFITFLDSDDWSSADRIEILVNEFRKDKDLGCVGSFGMRVNESGTEQSLISFETDYEKIKSALPGAFNFIGAAIMIHRKVLDEIGVYSEQFNRVGAEHLHWGGKIILKYKMINVPLPLYFYRHLENSFSNSNKRNVRGQLSNELAQIALVQLRDFGRDILAEENREYYSETMNFLMMKYNFWNGNFYKGLRYYLKGRGKNLMKFTESNRLLVMYFRKWMRQKLFFSSSKTLNV